MKTKTERHAPIATSRGVRCLACDVLWSVHEAAPELLEALKDCIEGLRKTSGHLVKNDCFNSGLDYDPCPCSLCLANRAIAKAEDR